MKKCIIVFVVLFSFILFYNLNGSKVDYKKPKFTERSKTCTTITISGKKQKKLKKILEKFLKDEGEIEDVIIITESIDEVCENSSPVEQEKQMECEEVKTQSNFTESDEQRIINELSCMNAFQALATQMALLPQTEFMHLKHFFAELKEIYESWSKKFDQVFLMQETEFLFCIGLIAYYLSDEPDIQLIKEWFQKLFGKEMNREEGIELIKQSPGEQAYWFIEGLSAECYNGNE